MAIRPIPPTLIKTKAEGAKLINPLKEQADELTVETAEDYTIADELLGRIRSARKVWEGKMETVLAPLRTAKTAADTLKREVDRPLMMLETDIKDKMLAFKREEQRLLDKARQEADAATQKLTRKIEETATRETNARTQQMRDRLTIQRETLEEELGEVMAETPVEVKGTSSQVRKVKKWRAPDVLAIAKAIAAGTVPADVLQLNAVRVNAQMTQDASVVAAWGFEVYEDLLIAGR